MYTMQKYQPERFVDLNWDYIVCGAGLAGLYTTYKLATINPDWKILVLHDGLPGGKISSQTIAVPIDIPTETYCIESGASRFRRTDEQVMKLIHELDLTTMIVNEYKASVFSTPKLGRTKVYVHFKEDTDKEGFYDMLPEVMYDFDINAEFRTVFRTLEQLKISSATQLESTFYDLLKYQIYPFIYKGYKCKYKDLSRTMRHEVRMRLIKFIHSHGIDADFTICNAWVALHILHKHYAGENPIRNKARNNYSQYVTLASNRGGMSQIPTGLVQKLREFPNVTLRRLHVTTIDIRDKYIKAREVKSRTFHIPYEFTCSREIIIAIPAENLRQISLKNKFFDHDGHPINCVGKNSIFNQIY